MTDSLMPRIHVMRCGIVPSNPQFLICTPPRLSLLDTPSDIPMPRGIPSPPALQTATIAFSVWLSPLVNLSHPLDPPTLAFSLATFVET